MEALTRFLPRAALRVAGRPLALAREATWPVGCEGRWWQVGERGWSASLWASPCLLVLSSQSKGARRQTSTGRWATRGSFAAPSSLLELRREGPGLQGRSSDRHPSTRRPGLGAVTAENPGELLGRWVISIIICQVRN